MIIMTTPVENAINDKSRPRRDFARDARDSTAQVLAFTGVKPGEVVLDFLPFRGYFTRLFSSIVGENGHVYASVPRAHTAVARIANEVEEIRRPVESRL
jgi:predicted methyltransferase